MLKKVVITVLALFILAVSGFVPAAAGSDRDCPQLDGKPDGDMVKYSLDAEVNGPVFFHDIRCGIRYRNRELCAMEMISFDTSARVYDYYSSEKIAIGKAYFWLDEKNPGDPVLAFSSRDTAENFVAEKGGGEILDYTGLTDRMLR
jgi:hypothetical protein